MSTDANYSEELLLLAETLGEVKTRTERLEAEFTTNAKPIENATGALAAALSGIKALQFHITDNNLGALSARVEEMRKAVDEQVGVIALELKKADETNAAKAGASADALRSEIVALQSQLGSLVTQFGQQLERVEFAAKEEAKKLQLIPGPAGAAGASLNPRGTFIDGEVYNRLDVVSWLGSSYIATVDDVTEKPSKNSNQWQVLASRGGNAGGASMVPLPDVYGKPSNGQVLIGNGNDYVNSTLTAGNGIAITNGAGSITIEATGAVNYQGAWNASTNTPTLTSSVGTKGYYYVVSVAGSTNLNGVTDWQAGDWAVFNGTAWEKIDNTDRVSSIFGRTGAVVGVSTDYSSVGLTNTAIGASNPSTGAFTTLSATGNATVGGTLTVSGASASIVGTAFFGASSDVQASRVAAGVLDVRHPSSTTSRIDVTGTTSAGIGYRQSGARDWFVSAESYELRTSCLTANSVASYESGVLVRVRDTTASSSTSTGALVVSGGVGVGGAINAGGNLTVSSAGSVFTGTDGANLADLTTKAAFATKGAGTLTLFFGHDLTANRPFLQASSVGAAFAMLLNPYGGNLLLGTTTDSGNGKLQLTSHTTSAGGIGFGTDWGIYRKSQYTLGINVASGAKPLFFYTDVTNVGLFDQADVNTTTGWSGYYITPGDKSLKLATNNTTALTLDSSQNATFAGGVTAGAVNKTHSFTGGDTGAGTSIVQFKDGNGVTKVNVTGDGKLVLSGILRLGNTYVSGAPTATGYVTIQDGSGNTYKVLVGT